MTPVLGERVQVEVDVPATPLRPFLKFSTAVETRRPVPRARVKFRVSVVSDGFPVIAHEGTVRFKGHNRWRHHWVDLAAWAGKRVTLAFETRPTSSGGDVPWADRIRAVWGDPVVGAREAQESAGRSPSVILIVIDALRYDYLGVNGFRGEVSPNLDWLALESVRFENAVAAAPWTKPSIATIFTGLHPETHGVLRLHRNSGEALSERAVTLAEVFREHGYRTAGFVGNALLSPPYGFQQGFETYLVDRRGDVLLDELRSWLSADGDAPYFVYLHLIGAHGPYRAPEADYRLLRASPSLGAVRKILPTDPPRPDHLEMTPFATVDEGGRLEAWKAKYAAAVRAVDRRLGVLLNELRRSGDLDRSLVVLTS
ncbi:MAG: sulfatase-like hydrolase/transferase, partial [Vicinamibacteria bacterium]